MQFESLRRSAFSNQSLRLCKKSVSLIVRLSVFVIMQKNVKMTARLTLCFVKSTKRHGIKQKKMQKIDEIRIPQNSAELLKFCEKTQDSDTFWRFCRITKN